MSSEKYKENRKWLERYITRSNGKKLRNGEIRLHIRHSLSMIFTAV